MTKKIGAVVSLLAAGGLYWLLFAQGRPLPPAEEKSKSERHETVAVVPAARVETIASPNFADHPKPETSHAEVLARKFYDPKSDAATRIRAEVEMTYGDILASFGLSGETLQKILELVAERYLSTWDASDLIDRNHRENGGVTTGGEWDKLRQQTEASIDAEIRQIVARKPPQI